ncbi:hypothetical protein KJE20_12717 [Pyrenophora tritici-repentis]|nr:hypothetical protein KJE20_12717 [Pyrenophora tritici-repentis]
MCSPNSVSDSILIPFEPQRLQQTQLPRFYHLTALPCIRTSGETESQRTLRTAYPAPNGVLSPQIVDTHESGRKANQTHPPSSPTHNTADNRTPFFTPKRRIMRPDYRRKAGPFAMVITAPASM